MNVMITQSACWSSAGRCQSREMRDDDPDVVVRYFLVQSFVDRLQVYRSEVLGRVCDFIYGFFVHPCGDLLPRSDLNELDEITTHRARSTSGLLSNALDAFAPGKHLER